MTSLHRDPAFEALMVRELAGGLGIDVTALNTFADRRAQAGAVAYGEDFPNVQRNLELDALEELADCRNYLCWRLEQIHRGIVDDEDRTAALSLALKHVANAFEAVRAAYRD